MSIRITCFAASLAALSPTGAFAQYDDEVESTSQTEAPTPTPRRALGPKGRGFGLGAETILNSGLSPVAALRGVYEFDGLRLRAEGLFLFSFVEGDQTSFGFGGRGFYTVHDAGVADFSVGTGVGVTHVDPSGVGTPSATLVHLELLGQIRAFIVSNVAINASLGMGMAFGDATVVSIRSQLLGGLGITYFF